MLRLNKGKGSKDRVVPLGKHAVWFLREYITKVRPKLTVKNRTCRHLFVNRYGYPTSNMVASIMIRKYVRAAKFKKQVTAHTFRHTFATVLMKNGADSAAVQKMMGHSDIKTTQGYLRSLGVDIKAVHKKTHPREKDKEDRKTAKPKIERVKGPYERK
jgi:integrase/recombinase XerD